MDGYRARQTDRQQADRQTDSSIDRLDRQKDTSTDRPTDRYIASSIDR